MYELLVDPLADLVALVSFTVVAGVLAVVGLLAEQAGVTNLATGHVALGIWYLWMGGLALFVGIYLLGYREVAPRLRGLLSGA